MTETVPGQAMLKCSQVTTITYHATASPFQSHPFLVSLYFLYHPYSTHFKFGESLYTCNIQYLLHCTEGCVCNSGEARKYDKYSMSSSLKFFRQNETQIVKSRVSLPVCLRQLLQVLKSIHLQADFTGRFHRPCEFCQFQYQNFRKVPVVNFLHSLSSKHVATR